LNFYNDSEAWDITSASTLHLGAGSTSVSRDLTILASGDVKVNSGNLVIGTAGKGIDFSAQSPSSVTGATTGDEVLDHYEEGTFTATIKGSTGNPASLVTATVANYTKIGRNVTIGIGYEGVDTTGYSGNFEIEGLPFDVLGHRAVFSVAPYIMGTFASSDAIVGIVSAGHSKIELQQMRSNAVWLTITHNAGAGGYMWISGTYIA